MVEAVSLDFFETLVFHRGGEGRGRALVGYLASHGLRHAPWEHQVLYDVFADHDAAYAPGAPEEERAAYRVRFARRLFGRLGVEAPEEEAVRHADALWRIAGPACFELFDDVRGTLEWLKEREFPVAVTSNWQSGLRHFCVEIGISRYLDHVLCSADVGAAKPDPRIFAEACARLGTSPERVIHVGDSLAEDYAGGEGAGMRVALLHRRPGPDPGGARVIRGLDELPGLLGAR